MGGAARVEAQAQGHGVGDGRGTRVGPAPGADVQLRPATGPGQPQRVLADEGVREVGAAAESAGPDGAGVGPGGIGDLELVPPLEPDVQVVGVAAEVELEVVERRPVVGRAAQEQRRGAQRGNVCRALVDAQLGGGGVGHRHREAVGAAEAALQLGAPAHEAAAVDAAEIGVGAPAFVADLEAVLARQPRDQLPAVAEPREALRLGRGPGVEAAAQVQGTAVQRVGPAGGIGLRGLRCRRQRGRQQQGGGGPHGRRRPHPFTPPAVRPLTIQRCASRNTSVIGSPLSTAAAAKSPHR